ncbi:MAG: glycosyltransferase family 4 protein [Ilumatobacteraceae bacterium]
MPAESSLRVGLVSDCYVPQVGGIEMQVHDLAQRLAAAGHDVVVVTPTAGPSEVDGIRVRRLDVPLLPFNIPFTPKSFRMTADVLEREGVDVAHFHGGIASPLSYAAAYRTQRAGMPTVITTHCMWSYVTPIFGALDRLGHWSRWNALFSAVSTVAAEPIERIAGPAREVLVLPNGITRADWLVEPAERDPHDVRVVSVMRLAPRKRPLHLLRMINQLRQRVPASVRLRVDIIGEGPERGSLERYLAAHRLGDVVALVGRLTRDEIRERYAGADIFVAPANLESFGIAALEARCAGVPVVAKRRTGISEFVEHGREGLLADSDRDMVDQLERLVGDPELRLMMAKHNRETPVPVEWPRVVDLNVAAYRTAIERYG